MSELFAQYRTRLKLGFRVEIYSYPNQNSTSRGRPGCMTARNPLRSLSWHAFKDHLDWGCRDGGPLISFFTNWHRAMHWRQWHINRGAKDVALMAVWLDGLQVYDAYEIAYALGVRRGHISQHQDEFLLYGGINEDDYRIILRCLSLIKLPSILYQCHDSHSLTVRHRRLCYVFIKL